MNRRFDIDGQFYVTYGWMRSRLGLKGSMLELYALVYGYHVRGMEFTGSLEYLREWTGLSRVAIIDSMKKLTDGDFFKKETIFVSNQKCCKYSINEDKLRNLTMEVKNVDYGSKESLPNNIEYNITNSYNNSEMKNLIERQELFRQMVDGYDGQYNREILNTFYNYWSEPTQNGEKMRFELQETWEVGRRLESWYSRENKYKKNNFKSDGDTIKPYYYNGTTNKQSFTARETENERRIREEREAIIAELGGAYEW